MGTNFFLSVRCLTTFLNFFKINTSLSLYFLGYLHLGGLRTALYNYLFARRHNGCFIIRIEDTDQKRIIPEAIEKLHEDLIWSGIIPDEDPIRGGPVGPYIQSKRLDLYREHIKILVDNGSAYKCFCSEHRLDVLRKAALKERQVPKYDNRCRHLSNEEIKEKLRRGETYCIRFKVNIFNVREVLNYI